MARSQTHRPRRIDLNTASRDALVRLDGIDARRADLILRHRPFRSWRELQRLDGFGGSVARRLRREATLGGVETEGGPLRIALGVLGAALAVAGAVVAAILTSRQREHQEIRVQQPEPPRRPSLWPRPDATPQRPRQPHR